jgi:hypothetical protein
MLMAEDLDAEGYGIEHRDQFDPGHGTSSGY